MTTGKKLQKDSEIQGKAWENNGKAEKKPLLELSLRELKNQIKQKYNKSFKRWINFLKKF